MFKNPIEPFLERFGLLIVDGGLATELERRGHDLSDRLWSARLLKDDPAAIRQVHYDYLVAGADCVISASYQATREGFVQVGLRESEAEQLLRRSVQLALEAHDQFCSETGNRTERLRPLVAASIGPYGAYLADGSEYTGRYGLSEEQLLAFHRWRWHILSESGPDLLACETIPSAVEARALARLLPETPEMPAWFSFSCRDEQHISDGTPLAECVAPLDALPQVVAIGINCTAPRYIPSLVSAARGVSQKPVIVYPNSGERYDPVSKQWSGLSVPEQFAEQSREWRAAGASLLGGCCRTGPEHIRQLRQLHRSGRKHRVHGREADEIKGEIMPSILRIAEAVLYVDELQEATRFYNEVLQMPISASFGDATFLQSGPDSTLILFDREKLGTRESPIPAHGAEGPGHVALAVAAEELDSWRARLHEHGIEIEHEQQWPQGTRSVYFRDPAGNSLEFIEGHHYELVWQRLSNASG